ncbi:MAG: glycosyltransferase family 39 protein [Myxococcota bacterium]|nr:glycosyltransferase family 39 protein [Myxococcota bacterium]
MEDGAQRSGRRRTLLAIAVATLAGLALRSWQLDRQILIDDEFHAFRAGLRSDLSASYLFSHNTLPEDPLSDYSSALALWVRALAETVGISEWTLRLPMVAASAAVALVLGLLAWRSFGRRAGVLAAWLAALSPLLIVYGRFARPYALVALCGAIALAAAERFRARGSLPAALALGSAVALGAWFNASSLPALGVLGLLGFAAALRGRQGVPARRAAAVGIGLGGGLAAALIGPSAEALARFAEAKAAVASVPPPSAWWGGAQAVAGIRAPLGVAAFGLAVLAGAVTGLRRAPAATGLALAAIVAQLGAFVLLRPYGSEQPLVIARYAIAAFPGLLLLAAAGLARGLDRLPSPAAAASLGTASLLLWAGFGPLPVIYGRENAYASHPSTLVAPLHAVAPAAVPSFYRELQTRPNLELVEAPWVLEWPLAIPADYQVIHGGRVRALTGFWTFREPGVRLAAMVGWRGDVPDLTGVDLVVVHRDLVEEWSQLTGGPATMPLDRLREAAQRYRIDAAALDGWLSTQRDWERGYQDRWLHVYRRR